MMVSIIVTTKNEEKNIANCLRSIRNSINSINPTTSMNQGNPTVEIIVVDNNSSGNTVKIAKEFTDKVYNRGPKRSARKTLVLKKQST